MLQHLFRPYFQVSLAVTDTVIREKLNGRRHDDLARVGAWLKCQRVARHSVHLAMALVSQALEVDVQMQLPHSGNQHLACLCIGPTN